ncbi:MAG: sulfite exporter TauE/SafE family protein [Bacteroidetes bacterium]|nr:sulfite exporter TauE/SafE family protein [Bacteroidota bacterium]
MLILPVLLSALALGFLGSFHCIGMCGPLALSLPVSHLTGLKKIAGVLLYNLGRILVYALLGLLLGWIGMTFQFFGWQQFFSIALGIFLLLIFLMHIMHQNIFQNNRILKNWNKLITQKLSNIYQKKSYRGIFLIGLLNGLLPCGLVYMAIAGALASAHILYSSLFMAAFGAGTLPAMMSVSLVGGLIPAKFRKYIKIISPYIIGVMGVILILRGLNLGIPFLSPVLQHPATAIECSP